jgi:sigma-E factor negative regulatory protein RseC
MSGQEIVHEGIVQAVRDSNITVSFITQPACSSCSVKNSCTLADSEVRNIEIPAHDKAFQVGEKVNVVLSRTRGFHAVFLGYLLPMVLVFASLAISLKVTNNEAFAGLVSISLLIPYYLILWLLRGVIKKNFKFKLVKS